MMTIHSDGQLRWLMSRALLAHLSVIVIAGLVIAPSLVSCTSVFEKESHDPSRGSLHLPGRRVSVPSSSKTSLFSFDDDNQIDIDFSSLPKDQRQLFVLRCSESPAPPSWMSSVRQEISRREAIAQADLVDVMYVPHDGVLVYCLPSTARRLLMRDDVLIGGLFRPQLKLPTSALSSSEDRHNEQELTPKTQTQTKTNPVVPGAFTLLDSLSGIDKSVVTVVVHLAVHPQERSVKDFVQEEIVGPSQSQVSHFSVVERHGIAHLYVDAQADVEALIRKVVQLPRVVSASVKAPAHVFNAVAASIVDHGYPDGKRLYSGTGLTGQGETVAVGDSGLDFWACLFANGSSAGTTEPAVSNWRKTLTEDERAQNTKIVGYWSFMDALWDWEAHGTHVAGTVAGRFDGELNPLLAEYSGVAPEAQLLFTDIMCNTPAGCKGGRDAGGAAIDCPCPAGGSISCEHGGLFLPTDIGSDFLSYAVDNDVWIHTNSWGSLSCGDVGCHTDETQMIDEYIQSEPELLVLFAAANEGRRYRISDQAHAKNVLSVGASRTGYAHLYEVYDGNFEVPGTVHGDSMHETLTSWETLAWFSSMGPTYDGRIKPDVVAPGDRLASAYAFETGDSQENKCGEGWRSISAFIGNHVAGMSGTSMATPAVAGYAALVRQYLREFYPNEMGVTAGAEPIENPPASLMKAMIINSARTMVGLYSTVQNDDDMNTVYVLRKWDPYTQGFGRVSLENIIPLNSTFGYHTKVLAAEESALTSAGQQQSFTVAIPGGMSELRVTLVWTDYKSSSNYEDAGIVSDLDLTVTVSSSGDVHYGNEQYFSSVDHKNNVERVVLENPSAGTYTVKVRAYALPGGPQKFSVVASYGVSNYKAPSIEEPEHDSGAAALHSVSILPFVGLLAVLLYLF